MNLAFLANKVHKLIELELTLGTNIHKYPEDFLITFRNIQLRNTQCGLTMHPYWSCIFTSLHLT